MRGVPDKSPLEPLGWVGAAQVALDAGSRILGWIHAWETRGIDEARRRNGEHATRVTDEDRRVLAENQARLDEAAARREDLERRYADTRLDEELQSRYPDAGRSDDHSTGGRHALAQSRRDDPARGSP